MGEIKKQPNRREFLISSGRKLFLSVFGIIGLSLGYNTLTTDKDTLCEVNLPCRNCFKLGNCSEDKASETRNKVNEKDQPNIKSRGKENG